MLAPATPDGRKDPPGCLPLSVLQAAGFLPRHRENHEMDGGGEERWELGREGEEADPLYSLSVFGDL
uniref:Uncharacterized protein n=1 Tax=Leersia perrieri TaxID=77586 RepID=A0A0D9VAA4_9ORYZ